MSNEIHKEVVSSRSDYAHCTDLVLRTPLTKAQLAFLHMIADCKQSDNMECVKVVAETYSVHAYYQTVAGSTTTASALADWAAMQKANGNQCQFVGTCYKAFDLVGRYCGRFNTATGKATIIVWRVIDEAD